MTAAGSSLPAWWTDENAAPTGIPAGYLNDWDKYLASDWAEVTQ
jgi:hypothetical protein